MFLWMMALRQKLTVVYEIAGSNQVYYFSESKCEMRQASKLDLGPNDVYLYDCLAGNTVTIPQTRARLVVFSSNNGNNYKQYIRYTTTQVVLFPSLSDEEYQFYADWFQLSPEQQQIVEETSGKGKIRPIAYMAANKYDSYVHLLNSAVLNIDFQYFRCYMSIVCSIAPTPDKANPAILFDAVLAAPCDDPNNYDRLVQSYEPRHARWFISSSYIVNRIVEFEVTKAAELVMALQRELRTDYKRVVGPLSGCLFEHVAPRCIVEQKSSVSDFDSKSKLSCQCLDWRKLEFVVKHTADQSDDKVDCDKSMSKALSNVRKLLASCTNQSTMYDFGRNQPAFDAFVPPNVFISFASSVSDNFNHPICLATALALCQLVPGSDNVKFITAVPSGDSSKGWIREQSFVVNVEEHAKKLNKKINCQCQESGLPVDAQTALKRFKQYTSIVDCDSQKLYAASRPPVVKDETVLNMEKVISHLNLIDTRFELLTKR